MKHEKISTFKNFSNVGIVNRGFTLIELIVVIAVIGILVLIAAPKSTDVIQKAQHARILNDVKVAGNKVETHLVSDDKFPEEWVDVKLDTIHSDNDNLRLYDINGLVPRFTEFDDGFVEIPKSYISSSLGGSFYVAKDGSTYYSHPSIKKVNYFTNIQTEVKSIKDLPNDTAIVNGDAYNMTYLNSNGRSQRKLLEWVNSGQETFLKKDDKIYNIDTSVVSENNLPSRIIYFDESGEITIYIK